MPKATNQTVYDLVQQIAPFESQDAFDNAGFLVGDPDAALSAVLLALDCSPEVIKEARELGAQLILSHHPLLFHGVKQLREDQGEGRLLSELIRSKLALISAHTNLDKSRLSPARLLAAELRLANLRRADDYVLVGDLPSPMRPDALGRRLSSLVGSGVRSYGPLGGNIVSLAIAGGAYCDGYAAAIRAGAQALLTGEVKHYNALAAAAQGFVMYDGSHGGTEMPMMAALGRYLQKQLDDLEYSVRVYVSGQMLCPETHLCKEDT